MFTKTRLILTEILSKFVEYHSKHWLFNGVMISSVFDFSEAQFFGFQNITIIYQYILKKRIKAGIYLIVLSLSSNFIKNDLKKHVGVENQQSAV